MNDSKIELLIHELQEQKSYLKKQVRLMQCFTILLAALVIGLCAVAFTIGPKLATVLDTTEQIVQDLDLVTSELAEADLSGMLDNVNELVIDSQDTMEEALKKIEAIDIETLNDAIDGLNTVVSPLANLFGR